MALSWRYASRLAASLKQEHALFSLEKGMIELTTLLPAEFAPISLLRLVFASAPHCILSVLTLADQAPWNIVPV